MKYEAVRLVSKFNVSIPSEAPSPLVKDVLEPVRGDPNWQSTGDEVFFHDHLRRASLPQE